MLLIGQDKNLNYQAIYGAEDNNFLRLYKTF